MYILIAILIFGALIAIHEAGHFAAAKLSGVRVNEFAIGMGPAIFKRQKGETLYSLRIFPMGGYCAMEDEDEESDDPHAFTNATTLRKLFILAAGPFMNLVAGLLLCFLMVSFEQGYTQPVITGFFEQFPQTMQGEQGLMPGDRIYSIDGERIYLYDDITLMFGLNKGETMDLVVQRDGQKITLNDYPLAPREYVENGETVVKYGLYFQRAEHTFGSRVANGFYSAIDFMRQVRLSLGLLFGGDAGLRDLSGPVGIVGTIAEVGNTAKSIMSALYFVVYMAALISVNLAVMNLLPLPALDGGRIFFLLLNSIVWGVSHRHIPQKYEGYVHMTGMVLLMGLMLVVTFSDIGKLIGI